MLKYIVNIYKTLQKGGELVRYNENEYCIEMSADELCHLVARPGDLDARMPSSMNVQSRSFDAFLSQMPDYERALESVRCMHSILSAG